MQIHNMNTRHIRHKYKNNLYKNGARTQITLVEDGIQNARNLVERTMSTLVYKDAK
jgi:hypothetical protein